MLTLQCPICKNMLYSNGVSLLCCNHHTFDISRYHYVNLAMDNRSSKKHHGDDRLMIRSRRDFLDKGYYKAFRDLVVNTALDFLDENSNIVDVGCGEGYYTDALQRACNGQVLGIDLSKDALRYAGKRNNQVLFAVAGANSIPVPDSSCHMILNLFAPYFPEEFSRVLVPGGILLRGVPTEDHLWGLKKAVYDQPYRNPAPETQLDGFEYADQKKLKYTIELETAEDIQNLFRMTPYYYKTGIRDQEKLSRQNHLITELGFAIQIYRKPEKRPMIC